MESKIKVYAKSQNRIALGVINAYLVLYPEATLDDLRKAFPDSINPDCGSKQLFMTENDINEHVKNGEEWYASPRGYFVKEKEWLVMPDGERVGFVSMWSKPSLERLIAQAKEYGIEAVESDEKAGTYRIEHINVTESTENKIDNNETVIDGIKKAANNIFEAVSTAVGDATKFVGEQITSIIKGDNDTESNSFSVTYDGKDYPMALQYKITKKKKSEYPTLTAELDKYQGKELTLEDINKITLWKIGRFPFITSETLANLNLLKDEKSLDVEKTTAVLTELLNTTGVGLPMASTYLRFINPDVYQIIDVRAYRAAFDYKKYKHDYTIGSINKKIKIYIEYLQKLREIAEQGYHGFSTEFRNLDRFLYNFDKQAAKLSCVIRKDEDDPDEAWEEAINRTLDYCNEISDDDIDSIGANGMFEFVVSYDDCQYSMSLQYNNSDDEYPTLTKNLDKLQGKNLTLEDIHKITLWKIGRFPFMTPETLAGINSLKDEKTFDEDKTTIVLNELLNTKGIGLPMASTYLRFINPDVYQIIDVRAYRAANDYEHDETDYKYEDAQSQTETYIDYLRELREIAEQGYHGLSTAFRNMDRFLYNFDKITVLGAQSDWPDDCWDKAIQLTLEKCNCNDVAKEIPEMSQPENEPEGEMRTYKLRIESESLYQIWVGGLENADEKVIEEGFENEENWVDLVGNTLTLGMQMGEWKEKIGDNWYDEDTTEAVETILDMVEDGEIDAGVDNTGCFPDAEEDFQIVVLDEDDEEIDTIDSSDIKMFEVHDGHNYRVDFVEDDVTRQMARDYLIKSNQVDTRCDDFDLYHEGWTWVNVQHGETFTYPEYEIEINGEFDPDKLLIMKNVVYDSLGDYSIEAVTKIIYDGKELEELGEEIEQGEFTPSEGQTINLFIKRENPSEEASPDVAYNMSTLEKA